MGASLEEIEVATFQEKEVALNGYNSTWPVWVREYYRTREADFQRTYTPAWDLKCSCTTYVGLLGTDKPPICTHILTVIAEGMDVHDMREGGLPDRVSIWPFHDQALPACIYIDPEISEGSLRAAYWEWPDLENDDHVFRRLIGYVSPKDGRSVLYELMEEVLQGMEGWDLSIACPSSWHPRDGYAQREPWKVTPLEYFSAITTGQCFHCSSLSWR